jgi:hypothetical protein
MWRATSDDLFDRPARGAWAALAARRSPTAPWTCGGIPPARSDSLPVKTKWDKTFSFSVGTDEPHEITVHWAEGLAGMLIEVDGHEALRERHPLKITGPRQHEVTVGTAETHKVVVEKRTGASYGGVRARSFRVTVDDHVLGEYWDSAPEGF